jgi:hypothetical protein
MCVSVCVCVGVLIVVWWHRSSVSAGRQRTAWLGTAQVRVIVCVRAVHAPGSDIRRVHTVPPRSCGR